MKKTIEVEQKVPLVLIEVTSSEGHLLMVAPMEIVAQVYDFKQVAIDRAIREMDDLGYCQLYFNKRVRFADLGSIVVKIAKVVEQHEHEACRHGNCTVCEPCGDCAAENGETVECDGCGDRVLEGNATASGNRLLCGDCAKVPEML